MSLRRPQESLETNMAGKEDFMALVQLHEREWGREMYLNRPTLQAILSSPVVTVWRPIKEDKKKRFTFKVYPSTAEVEQYMTKLLFRAHINPPTERLVRVYIDRKPVIVKAVRILFEELTTE